MKKKAIIIALLLFFGLFSKTASVNVYAEESYASIYENKVNEWHELQLLEENKKKGSTSLWMAYSASYNLIDLDGSGMPELIIKFGMDGENSKTYIFSFQNEEPSGLYENTWWGDFHAHYGIYFDGENYYYANMYGDAYLITHTAEQFELVEVENEVERMEGVQWIPLSDLSLVRNYDFDNAGSAEIGNADSGNVDIGNEDTGNQDIGNSAAQSKSEVTDESDSNSEEMQNNHSSIMSSGMVIVVVAVIILAVIITMIFRKKK